MIERKRYYSRSVEDKGTIKIIREIFYTELPKINLINVNYTLKQLRQVKEHLKNETRKVIITT